MTRVIFAGLWGRIEYKERSWACGLPEGTFCDRWARPLAKYNESRRNRSSKDKWYCRSRSNTGTTSCTTNTNTTCSSVKRIPKFCTACTAKTRTAESGVIPITTPCDPVLTTEEITSFDLLILRAYSRELHIHSCFWILLLQSCYPNLLLLIKYWQQGYPLRYMQIYRVLYFIHTCSHAEQKTLSTVNSTHAIDCITALWDQIWLARRWEHSGRLLEI